LKPRNGKMSKMRADKVSTENKILQFLLLETWGGTRDVNVGIGMVARSLGIKHSTTSMAARRLQHSRMVVWEPYGIIKPTLKGLEKAKELWRHQRMLELLLVNEVGVDPERAHKEASKLELPLSCESVNAICEKYGHPTECPCGIPVWLPSLCQCESDSTPSGKTSKLNSS
jgi:Mn-dependent DtxR family transcriptional regulator